MRSRDRTTDATTAAGRASIGGSTPRGRQRCGACADAFVRSREGLAHGRPCLDGAGRRLGRGEAPAPDAALDRGSRCRARAGADRLGAAHRRRRCRLDAVFNWLLYGYGVPALAFWTAGYLLRRRRDDVPSRIMDAAAILFTVLFGFLEVRHAMNGGDIYASPGGLAETALHVAVGLAIAIGLERLRVRTRNVVHNVAALVIAALTLFGIVFGLFGFDLPLVTESLSAGLLNLLLLGYALPAVLAVTLALMARSTRPMPYRAAAAGVAVLLGLAYLTLQVMRLYHGPVLPTAPSATLSNIRSRRYGSPTASCCCRCRLPYQLEAGAARRGRGDPAHHRQGIRH